MTKKRSIIYISIIAACVALVLVFVLGLQKRQNKETIVDLGDGWKSYSHEDIGITVKIPEDSGTSAKKKGEDKKDRFEATFTKGLILASGALFSGGMEDANNRDKIYLYYESLGYSENEWNITKYGRDRRFYKDVVVDGKIVIFPFSEVENTEKKELKFSLESVHVLGRERRHYLSLNQSYFAVVKDMTREHPHFTEEEIENFTQEYINTVSDLIVSINNF